MTPGPPIEAGIDQAADALARADALVVAAGAGMGVDSGLPDFRGNEGFWNAYPPAKRLGLSFVDLANPRWFESDPGLAWGFYGHRLELYRRTRPHDGFGILRAWAERMPRGHFVCTSNIDGHFARQRNRAQSSCLRAEVRDSQAAGFAAERVAEVHGSLARLQCLRGCGAPLAPAAGVSIEVDLETLRARPPFPSCAGCGGLARPNVLMFGDWGWDGAATQAQEARFEGWLRGLPPAARVVVVECGAGTAIATIRRLSEEVATRFRDGLLVRVNVREPEAPEGHVGLPLGALEALRRIDARLAAISRGSATTR